MIEVGALNHSLSGHRIHEACSREWVIGTVAGVMVKEAFQTWV